LVWEIKGALTGEPDVFAGLGKTQIALGLGAVPVPAIDALVEASVGVAPLNLRGDVLIA
jgi:hypothetical protein